MLKVLTPEAAEDPVLVAWLEREAAAVAAIEHPNVVALRATGREAGRPYLVTEFIEGWSLAEALTLHGALPPELAAYVAAEAARGLAAAHEAGVLHRDLKPANVLLGADGRVTLADFGLASRVSSGEGDVRGTLGYLAPEVIRGESAGPAADLFALGAMLAEMLGGHPVFASETVSDALDAALHGDPVPALRADPRLPAALVDVVERLLDKDPSQRYTSAAEAARALDAHRRTPGLGDGPVGKTALAAFLDDPDAYRASRPVVVPPHLAAPILNAETQHVARQGDRAPESSAISSRPARRRPALLGLGALVLGMVLMALALRSNEEPRATVQGTDQRDSLVVQLAEPGTGTQPEEAFSDGLPEAAPEAAPVSEEPTGDETTDDVRPPSPAATPQEGATQAEEPSALEPEAVQPPQTVPGRLEVAVQPWAEVVINGQSVGEGPLVDVGELAEGTHRVQLRHPDFPDVDEVVRVASGETTQLRISLWNRVARATLLAQPWAEATLDGRSLGVVPPQQTLILTPGAHTLTLTHPTLGTWTTTIQVRAGETPALRYNLTQLLSEADDF